MTQRRNFYRIVYPAGAQPIVQVHGSTCHLVELSEGGGRIALAEAKPSWFQPGAEVTIEFFCQRSFRSEATLIRVDDSQMVLRFEPPIPLAIILEEQRLLIVEFGKDEG